MRRRTVDSLAEYGGTECTGYEEEIQVCNTQCCPGEMNIYLLCGLAIMIQVCVVQINLPLPLLFKVYQATQYVQQFSS